MPKLFISYRRDDSDFPAHSLYESLKSKFGEESVFIDVDTIPPGVDFRKHLNDWVGGCDVLLAVVGSRWLDIRNQSGDRRLDDPTDFVRIEIETALERDIPVIPVLVGRVTMPSEANLPAGLREFSYRNAVEVRSGRDFDNDVGRMISGIEKLLRSRRPTVPAVGGIRPQAVVVSDSPARRFRWGFLGAAALSVLLLVGTAAVLFKGGVGGDPLVIQTVEAADSPEIIGQAVGLVVSGWKYRGADRKTKEESYILGPPFDGPYEKQETDGNVRYVEIKNDEKQVMATTGRYWKERKNDINIYHPFSEDLCITQNGVGQLIHSLGGTGTCFMITADGYAITNKHVVEDAYGYQQSHSLLKDTSNMDRYKNLLKPMIWVFFDGQQYEAEIVYVSDDYDVSLLKIKGKKESPFFSLCSTISESIAPRGSKVYALGYPGAARVAMNEKERVEPSVKEKLGDRIKDRFADSDFDYSQNDGSISRVVKRDVGMLIQHDADINPGNSGGPLVNKNGLVYGINIWTITGASGVHFSLAIDQLREEIERHMTTGSKPLWK